MADLPEHPGKRRWAYNIVVFAGRMLLRFKYKIKLEGHGNFPETGPLLILAKHQKLDDIPLGLGALNAAGKRRDHWCVMKDSLAAPHFFGFFLKCGGIPINRREAAKSKGWLLFARHRLHEGNAVVIFPEQTFFPNKMGKGKVPGFRFVAGRPETPIAVAVVGFSYEKKGFGRVVVTIRLGKPSMYGPHDDPDHFLHDRMLEMAELSKLEYPHERPQGKSGQPMDDEDD